MAAMATGSSEAEPRFDAAGADAAPQGRRQLDGGDEAGWLYLADLAQSVNRLDDAAEFVSRAASVSHDALRRMQISSSDVVAVRSLARRIKYLRDMIEQGASASICGGNKRGAAGSCTQQTVVAELQQVWAHAESCAREARRRGTRVTRRLADAARQAVDLEGEEESVMRWLRFSEISGSVARYERQLEADCAAIRDAAHAVLREPTRSEAHLMTAPSVAQCAAHAAPRATASWNQRTHPSQPGTYLAWMKGVGAVGASLVGTVVRAVKGLYSLDGMKRAAALPRLLRQLRWQCEALSADEWQENEQLRTFVNKYGNLQNYGVAGLRAMGALCTMAISSVIRKDATPASFARHRVGLPPIRLVAFFSVVVTVCSAMFLRHEDSSAGQLFSAAFFPENVLDMALKLSTRCALLRVHQHAPRPLLAHPSVDHARLRSRSRVVLCFLIVDKFPFEDIWRRWLDSADGAIICVFNARYPSKVASPWVRSRLLKHGTMPAGWGDICRPMLALLDHAVGVPQMSHAVFVSESCIPVVPARQLVAQFRKDPRSRILAHRHANWGHLQTVDLDVLPSSKVHKSETWMALAREHALAILHVCNRFVPAIQRQRSGTLVSTTGGGGDRAGFVPSRMDRAFTDSLFVAAFDPSWCSEELLFATAMELLGLLQPSHTYATRITATDWRQGGAHPRVYDNIDDLVNAVCAAREEGAIFIRKVAATMDFDSVWKATQTRPPRERAFSDPAVLYRGQRPRDYHWKGYEEGWCEKAGLRVSYDRAVLR